MNSRIHGVLPKRELGFSIVTLLILIGFANSQLTARPSLLIDDEPESTIPEELQNIQDLVGQWQGSGSGESSKGWDERVNCAWKFGKSGKASIYLTFETKNSKEPKGRLFDEGMFAYDTTKKKYVFKAYKAGAGEDSPPLVFEGTAKTDTNIVVDRVLKSNETSDGFDRIDFKILNDGDRLVYLVQRRIGASKQYKKHSQVALDRQGTSLAGGGANLPKCIVTGGAGTMTVSFEGQTYYVCCTGCREMFMADPKRYIAKAEKQKK